MALRRFDNIPVSEGPNRGALSLAMANPFEDTLAAIEKFGQAGAVSSAETQARSEVMGGGNPGLSLGLTPAGQAYNDAAQKAYEVRTSLDVRAKHAELSAKFTGQNPGDAAAYAETMGQYVAGIGANVPESIKPQIMAEANLRYSEGLASVTEATNKHQYQLHVSEIATGYKASVDDAEGLAMAGRSDLADAALLQSLARVDDMVNVGSISAGEGELMKREARSQVAAGTLYQGFLSGHVPLEAVQRGEIGAELPGHVRESLVRKMEAEQAHRRSEQNFRDGQVEKAIRQGDRDLNAMTAKLKLGVPLRPDEQVRFNAYSTGGAAASPLQVEEARAAHSTLNVSATVASAKPEQIATVRGLWAANPPASTEEALIRKTTAEAFDRRESALKTDAMAYAMEVLPGKFPAVAFPSDINSPEMGAALRQLSDNADGLKAQFGVDEPPMTKPDQQRFAAMFAGLPGEQRTALRSLIEVNMGPNAMKIWETLGKEGAGVAAHAGILSAQGRGDVANTLDTGKELLDRKLVIPPTPQQVVPAFYSSGIPAAFAMDTKAQDQIRDAAVARAAYLANMAGKPEDVASHLAQAFKDVGGATTDYNGQKIALPLGVNDSGVFLDRLESVTPNVAATLGWPAGVAEAIASGEARLTSFGEGKYGVTIGTVNVPGFELDWGAIPAPSVVRRGMLSNPNPLPSAAPLGGVPSLGGPDGR